MNEAELNSLKKNIVAIGRLLWEKDMVSVLNGNISARVDDERILLTAGKTCLGILQEKDVLLMNLNGEMLEEGHVSTEKLLHTEVYKNFPDVKAIVHTHTVFTNAYFLENDTFEPRIFESKLTLGTVQAVEQNTPSVTDAAPVIGALKKNNVIVLKNHGTVAMARDLFDCFLMIQSLEDAIKIDAVSRLYKMSKPAAPRGRKSKATAKGTRKAKAYALFSQEQIDEIVKLVNSDQVLQEMGEKTNMTMDLAVKWEETGRVYCFRFEKGRIASVSNNENAEFLITASEKIWRQVFNREIDPFVATTQKKMNLKGDLAKISKWYAPCNRIFELWQQVPVA